LMGVVAVVLVVEWVKYKTWRICSKTLLGPICPV
jgi:hypothetical protein